MSMLTGAQVRAARMVLRWTVQDLARVAAISVSTVKRLEVHDDVPPISAKNLQNVQSALEAAGIEFIGTPDDGPGIRIRTGSRD